MPYVPIKYHACHFVFNYNACHVLAHLLAKRKNLLKELLQTQELLIKLQFNAPGFPCRRCLCSQSSCLSETIIYVAFYPHAMAVADIKKSF